MIVLGLTGSIAMGKSRTLRMFQAFGVPVYDADAAVHALYAPGGAAVAPVAAAFPGTLGAEGGIDRKRLGPMVLGDPARLKLLEGIVHPLVRTSEGRFLRAACRAGARLAVLDIPLLFESGGHRRVDAVVVVSASRMLQADRALRRPGMTRDKLESILAKQLPDPQKRKRADFVIPSGRDGGAVEAHVRRVIGAALALRPEAWPGRWLNARKMAA